MKIPDKKAYKISVHQFVDMILLRGDLSSFVASTKRMQQGIQTHIKRQQEQKKICELPLEHTVEGATVELTIKGRADIVDISDEIDVIEEIKTIFGRQNKDKILKEEHLSQCKCYCAMYLMKKGLDKIGARLTYIQYEDSNTYLFEYEYTKDEILDWFNEKTNYLIDIFEKRQNHINKRNISVTEMKFPYDQYRAGQKEMAKYVYRGCRRKTIQFLQAPTGIGKTMGTIYPSIKAFVNEEVERIFYVTAKNTVKKIAKETIDTLREKGLVINSLTLTAKETSCPQKIFNCNPKVCYRARGYYDRLGIAMDCFEENKHYNIYDVKKIADRFNICPFELSLDISLECDIIICDFNNVYDPRARLKRYFDEGGQYAILVDEAHNLISRGRDMYSGQIDKALYIDAINKMAKVRSKQGLELLGYMRNIIDNLNYQINVMKEKDIKFEVLENPMSELNDLLGKFVEGAEALLNTLTTREYTKDLLETFYKTKGYLFTVSKADDNYVHYIFVEGANISIKMFCIDPSARLQEWHNKSQSTTFFSASLTPFDYYTRLLQNNSDYDTRALPSPFDKDNLKVMVNTTVLVEYKFRDRYIAELVKLIYTFVKGKEGKYLIFFPSYGYMEKAHSMFISLHDDIFAPKQDRNMDSVLREGFISLFEDDSHMAAFAVMGGVFSEGIDLKGERLIGAVVVGTGFPMISLENNFIKEYHNRKGEEGLGYAYVYPGFNKVLQAVGRVIRSEEDKGAVLLIDRRFMRQEYIGMMPDWWQPIEYVDNEDDIQNGLEGFWDTN